MTPPLPSSSTRYLPIAVLYSTTTIKFEAVNHLLVSQSVDTGRWTTCSIQAHLQSLALGSCNCVTPRYCEYTLGSLHPQLSNCTWVDVLLGIVDSRLIRVPVILSTISCKQSTFRTFPRHHVSSTFTTIYWTRRQAPGLGYFA